MIHDKPIVRNGILVDASEKMEQAAVIGIQTVSFTF